jgi:anti-sigma factor RsiW
MSSREPAHPEELLLLDYVIGQLPSETRDQIKRHVAACRACSRTIDDLILTVDELDRLPTMPIPHDSPADLRPPRLRPKSRIRWFVPALGVVLLGLLALVTFGGGHASPRPDSARTLRVTVADAAHLRSTVGADAVVVQSGGGYVVVTSPSSYNGVVQSVQELGVGPRRVVVVAVDPQDVEALRDARPSATSSGAAQAK